MKKKLICLILSTLVLSTCIPIAAFAGDLPDIKLEVPEFEIPDNMPDAFESLRDKYDMALEGLKAEGFGVNNFPNGLGKLEPPPGFGSSLDKLPDAESLFVKKYGDMWRERPLNKKLASSLLNNRKDAIKEWENSIPDSQKELTQKTLDLFKKIPQPELDNYISNLENKYKNMFTQALSGETAYENMKNAPSLEITNKWADLMKLPSNIESEYAFKTEEEKQNIINNRYLPEGFEEIKNTKIENSPRESNNFFDGIKNAISSIFGGKNNVEKKAEQQKEKDVTRYEDIYEKYYYKGGEHTSKEQNNQRKQILDVFKKYGIYNRGDDWGGKSKNKQEMGKLIEDNMDLLEKEIPGFKAFD
jgi:polyhydroxyalkanoate synthesis regulator phasin